MKILQANIPLALGDLINIKTYLDDVKHQYNHINLTFHRSLLEDGVSTGAPDWPTKKQKWEKYLNDVGKLFFLEPPYTIDKGQYPFLDTQSLVRRYKLHPRKPELSNLLCRGISLNVGEEYIVITTKVREVPRKLFYPLSINLWKVLNSLSKKYKIVILGERTVEMRKEYIQFSDRLFGIYDNIISNVPADRIIDLTVPSLGETVSDLTKIQQDCLIMKEAKFVITLGNGGNFCMASAVSNMLIGFRADNHWMADAVFTKEYKNAIVTKNWGYFMQVLERYI